MSLEEYTISRAFATGDGIVKYWPGLNEKPHNLKWRSSKKEDTKPVNCH